jgi:ABC-type amino acid transport system permease subunit
MLKDSSLVSILAVEELLFRAQLVGRQNFRSLEALVIAAAVYWILTIAFSAVQERLERRMARGDR